MVGFRENMPDWPGLLTTEQAMAFTNLGRETLLKLETAGALRATRVGTGRNAKILWPLKSLKALADSPPDVIDPNSLLAESAVR